jgi:NADH-quinone oxidoreductase subunit N
LCPAWHSDKCHNELAELLHPEIGKERGMSYLSLLRLAAPEVILVVSALAVLAADLLYLREVEPRLRRLICAILSTAGCLAAAGWMLALPETGRFLEGMLVLDGLRRIVQLGILGLAILTLGLSAEQVSANHCGEYFALVLLATVGMLFLVSGEDILMIFLSLELVSLCLYVLAAFHKEDRGSAEAALKYFLFGGMSAAFTLFGLSLVYGLSHSTDLTQIAKALSVQKLDPMLLLAIVMVAIGFAFKVAAAPFHLWAPDVYQGAPVPSAAFIASGSKVAGFFILAQVLLIGFKGVEGGITGRGVEPGWVPVLMTLSVLSMIAGNLAALVQRSVRRLLAYSAVAHGGYLLVAILAADPQAVASLVYYALTYAITAVGAFGVVAVVAQQTGGDRLENFAGLSRREPVLSFCMAVMLLSLAGIPPLAGFFGKFYVFSAALAGRTSLGLIWLVALALGMSAVSLYYYLKVLKLIYVREAAGPVAASPPRPPLTMAVVLAATFLTILLGCAPEFLVHCLKTAVAAVGR